MSNVRPTSDRSELLPTVMTVKHLRDGVVVCEVSGANWGDVGFDQERFPAEVLELVRSGKHVVVSARANVETTRRELLRVEGPFELISSVGTDEDRRPAGRRRRS